MKLEIAYIFLLSVLLYSCSRNSQSAFTQRKYFDFKRGNTEAVLPEPVIYEPQQVTIQQLANRIVEQSVVAKHQENIREIKENNFPVFTSGLNINSVVDHNSSKKIGIKVHSSRCNYISKNPESVGEKHWTGHGFLKASLIFILIAFALFILGLIWGFTVSTIEGVIIIILAIAFVYPAVLAGLIGLFIWLYHRNPPPAKE
jgi:hypothetical protein